MRRTTRPARRGVALAGADEPRELALDPGALGVLGESRSTVAASLSRDVAGSSDSRMPACAFTISPSDQSVMPSP